MAFSVTASPTSITLAAGGSIDVTYTFAGVPAELTDSVLESFVLGGVTVDVNVVAVLDEPDPAENGFTIPTGVTRQVVSFDRTQAVIRYSR